MLNPKDGKAVRDFVLERLSMIALCNHSKRISYTAGKVTAVL